MASLSHPPTDEQQAVIAAVAGRDSVMVKAGAGCAKSTTLEMAAPQVRVPALGLAFNKSIATALAPRMPGSWTIKTFNGLGFAAALRARPGAPKATVEDRKLGRLVSAVAKDRRLALSSEQWDDLKRLVTGAMQAGIVPGDRGRPLTPDTPASWESIAEDLWLAPGQFEFLHELAHEVLTQSIRLVEEAGVFSFDDQVYYSTCVAGQFPQYPFLAVDEAQDLNRLNHRMVELSMRPDGRALIVGDPKQSLYQFRGAVSNGMDQLRGLRQVWSDRDLLVSFRCPKQIVARQQHHVPGFRAWHTNPEGQVTQLGARAGQGQGAPHAPHQLEPGWTWEQVQELLPHPRASVMVLCRNNSPLLSLAFRLIRQQIGVVMLGREIGKGLQALSRKLLPEEAIPRDTCVGVIREWMESESSLARANKQGERVAGITDRGECLLAVLSSGCRDSGELRAMLGKLFSRDSGQVELSSIHRAKGLERDVILHLDPWRVPSRAAQEAAKAGDTEALQQEYNALYVAETRTRHTLIMADLQDFQSAS